MRCRACSSIYTSPVTAEDLCPHCVAFAERVHNGAQENPPGQVSKRGEKLLQKLKRKHGIS